MAAYAPPIPLIDDDEEEAREYVRQFRLHRQQLRAGGLNIDPMTGERLNYEENLPQVRYDTETGELLGEAVQQVEVVQPVEAVRVWREDDDIYTYDEISWNEETKEEGELQDSKQAEEEDPNENNLLLDELAGLGAGAGANAMITRPARDEIRRRLMENTNTNTLPIIKEGSLSYFNLTYKFTYTSQDVVNFNNAYYKARGYYPFTPTESTGSQLEDTDITTNDIKKYYKYAMDSYKNESELENATNLSYYNSQATIYNNEDNIVISWRGTEEIMDWVTDATTEIRLASTVGWIGLSPFDDVMLHVGANDYVDLLYLEILDEILKPANVDKNIYVTGHSLGSLASQIFAYRLFLEMRFRGFDNNIVGVYGYGGVKGIYSPTNAVDDALNLYSIYNYNDPVPYWFPIFGDMLGTKIILQDGGYNIYKRDVLTPYIGISLANSTEYFNRLQDGGEIDYFRKSMKTFYENMGLKRTRDLFSSIGAYPTGQYSFSLSLSSGGATAHGDVGGYDVSILEDLPDDIYLSTNTTEREVDNLVQYRQAIEYLNYDNYLFDGLENGGNPRQPPFNPLGKNNNISPVKILGYVANYNSNMLNAKIIF